MLKFGTDLLTEFSHLLREEDCCALWVALPDSLLGQTEVVPAANQKQKQQLQVALLLQVQQLLLHQGNHCLGEDKLSLSALKVLSVQHLQTILLLRTHLGHLLVLKQNVFFLLVGSKGLWKKLLPVEEN